MAIHLSKKDYIWSYIGVFLSLFGSIILTPFVVYFLDSEIYGLWGVFQSLAGITVLFDFGFTTTFSRNINYCWNGAESLEKNSVRYSTTQEPNFHLMKKAMQACRWVFLLISATALLIFVTAGTGYIAYISAHLNVFEVITAWLIYAFAIFLNLYFGYYSAFLRGVGAISYVNKALVFSRLVHILLTIILLACGFGIVGTSIAYLAYGTLFRQLGKKYFLNYKGIGKNLSLIRTKIPFAEVKEMFLIVWHNAWREGLVSLANYLSNSACTVICSMFLTLTETGAFSLGVHLATAVAQVAAAMYTANQPVLQSAYINKNSEKVKRTMALIVVSFTVMDVLGMAAVVIVGLPILRLIRPETVVGAGAMIGIGIYQFMLKFRNCYTSYFSCTNRILYVKAFVVSSVLCVIFSVVTLGILDLGLAGIIGAQIMSQAIYNAWAWPLKAHKEMQLSVKDTIKLGMEEFIGVLLGFVNKRIKNG